MTGGGGGAITGGGGGAITGGGGTTGGGGFGVGATTVVTSRPAADCTMGAPPGTSNTASAEADCSVCDPAAAGSASIAGRLDTPNVSVIVHDAAAVCAGPSRTEPPFGTRRRLPCAGTAGTTSKPVTVPPQLPTGMLAVIPTANTPRSGIVHVPPGLATPQDGTNRMPCDTGLHSSTLQTLPGSCWLSFVSVTVAVRPLWPTVTVSGIATVTLRASDVAGVSSSAAAAASAAMSPRRPSVGGRASKRVADISASGPGMMRSRPIACATSQHGPAAHRRPRSERTPVAEAPSSGNRSCRRPA